MAFKTALILTPIPSPLVSIIHMAINLALKPDIINTSANRSSWDVECKEEGPKGITNQANKMTEY